MRCKNSTAQLLIAVRPPYFHSIVQSIVYFLTPHCQILHEDAFYCSCATITKNIALRHLEKKSKVEVVPLSSFMDEELEVEGALSTDSILNLETVISKVITSSSVTGRAKKYRLSKEDGIWNLFYYMFHDLKVHLSL